MPNEHRVRPVHRAGDPYAHRLKTEQLAQKMPVEGERFRPVWHGVYLPEERPALLDEDPHQRILRERTVKPEEPRSTGFTLVHVSGLPPDCEDDAVADKLRWSLLEGRRRVAAAVEAAAAVAAASALEGAKRRAKEAAARGEGGDDNEGRGGEAPPAAEAEVEAEPAACSEAAVYLPFLPMREDEAAPFDSCAVVRDKETLECKGYCFLSFETLEEAEAAVPLLNEAVEVAGCEIKAVLSKPKGMKVKPPPKSSKPVPEQHDLKCHRTRYKAVSKRAQHGKETCSGVNEGGEATVTRNSHGRMNMVCGTRTGLIAKTEADMCSSRSGFRA